jgi:hypothetical protein
MCHKAISRKTHHIDSGLFMVKVQDIIQTLCEFLFPLWACKIKKQACLSVPRECRGSDSCRLVVTCSSSYNTMLSSPLIMLSMKQMNHATRVYFNTPGWVYTERSDINCEVTQACVLRLAHESGLGQLNIKALFYWWVFCVLVTSLAITVTMTTNVPAFVSVLSCLWSLRMGCHAHAFQSAMLSFMAVMTEKWLAEAISEIVVVVWIPCDQAVDIGRCDYLPW